MIFRSRALPVLAALAFTLQSGGLASAATPGVNRAGDFVDGVPSMTGLRDLGRMQSTASVQLAFNLRYQHEDELDRDILLLSTKGSPLYHKFLSNRQWNAYFAPSERTVSTVASALRRAGFQVTSVSGDRGLIDAQAPAATVERYFGTVLQRVAQPDAGVRYLHVTPAVLPLELRPFVISVAGLDNLELYHPRPAPVQHGIVPDKIGGPVKGPDGGYGPRVLANGYKYPVQSGTDGTGHTVGITISGDILNSDLAAYLSYFQITQTGTITRVPIDNAHFSGGEVETTLDVETISGLAPGVNIIIYQFPNWTVKFINDTFAKVVSDNTVDAYSNSWAWCETADGTLWNNKSIHRLFKQSVAKGITPIFASGDDGAFTRGCNGALRVASPADDPYVVGLGGLSFTANTRGKITSDVGWSGSGGGVSVLFKEPSYQQGVAGTISTGRNVPDISLPADVEDAYYFGGGWSGPIGGTSWAAPAFNAMLVEIVQARGSRAGFVNPNLYTAASTFGSAVFTDITSGNNGHYSAGPGYDQVTGLGAPVGTGLVTHL
jgi:subtilase family serine protease